MKENWQNTTFNRKEYVMSQAKTKKLSQEEIIEALKTAKEAQTINIEMDGGEFKSK